MADIQIKTALISVYNKEGLDELLPLLEESDIQLISTGGTREYIAEAGFDVIAVEELTGYPSILDGRVKTLHPGIFGGILARREEEHLDELDDYDIPPIDLVIVDLYPFEETLEQTQREEEIIEQVDIGGISLLRAAAKNYKDVAIVPSRNQYPELGEVLQSGRSISLAQRRSWAAAAFEASAHYDQVIFHYLNQGVDRSSFKASERTGRELRYGENPHQDGMFYGEADRWFQQLNGKELSYNNLVDIDAAIHLIREFDDSNPVIGVIKHTNPCGCAVGNSVEEAWNRSFAGDPVSAFGSIIISSAEIDLATARRIDEIFYEVLLAPSFSPDALDHLTKKKKRILLELRNFDLRDKQFKSLLNGVIEQERDEVLHQSWSVVTEGSPLNTETEDLQFANRCVKHLKSNAIALAKDRQLIGMGCGQTSRIDALKQAIDKARRFNFELEGAVMASDAFFPFSDCVEAADEAGITAVVQPGGSIRDDESIEYCDEHGMAMICTETRHFKH